MLWRKFSKPKTATSGGEIILSGYTYYESSGAAQPSLTIPNTSNVGDLALVMHAGLGVFAAPAASSISSDWTELVNNSSVYIRSRIHYAILTESMLNTGTYAFQVGGLGGGYGAEMMVFSGADFSSLSVPPPTFESTAGDPTTQTIVMSGQGPIIYYGFGVAASQTPVVPSLSAGLIEPNSAAIAVYAYGIYQNGDAMSNQTIDITDISNGQHLYSGKIVF